MGCIDPKMRGHLMCRHHWRMVSAALRQAVNATWKAIRSPLRGSQPEEAYAARLGLIRKYREATAAAITFVTDQESLKVNNG